MAKTKPEKFVREVRFYPAYDKRSDVPSKNYGIHNVDCRFLLFGKKGVIQFLFCTGWFLPETAKEYHKDGNDLGGFWNHTGEPKYPDGTDLGYHSPKKMYKGQTLMSAKCDILGGRRCYYDGSGLRAKPLMELLMREGSDAVWKELEKEYYRVFGEG